MIALEQARKHPETLELKQAVEALDNSLDTAAGRHLTYPEMLAGLLGVEVTARRERCLWAMGWTSASGGVHVGWGYDLPGGGSSKGSPFSWASRRLSFQASHSAWFSWRPLSTCPSTTSATPLWVKYFIRFIAVLHIVVAIIAAATEFNGSVPRADFALSNACRVSGNPPWYHH